MNFFLSKNACGRFFWRRRTLAHGETTVDSSQKEKVPKYAGFNVGAHVAQSTHSVCFSVFFVHFVYLLGRFSEVNIGYQPPPLQAYIIHKRGQIFFVSTPLCHILCHDFLLFSMLLYYFFYTHILINMYICCVFFKLPHSFDVSRCFIVIIWDESGITSES